MSHAADTTTAAAAVHDAGNDAWQDVLTRVQRPALIVGAVGLLITLIGLFTTTDTALRSYLWAFLYWAAIPLGSLAFLMIQHMTGGTWGLVARRFFEASASLIVLFAVLFIPLLIAVLAGNENLYPWLPDADGKKALGHAVNDSHLAFKSFWLSKGFFTVRVLVYFGIWTFLAYYLYNWSGREDRSGNNPKFAFNARRVAAPGILFGALAINFAMIDWVMTLDPAWYSTMFGVLYLVGCGLMTMAFTIFVIRLIADRKPIRDVIGWQVLNDLGNLMFAFTLLWAYTNFSQFLIMWSGNIAEETPYYYVRNKGSWGAVALIVVIFHFFTPFLLLLWRKIKRDIRLLAFVALGVMVMRSVDLFWIVKPMFIQRTITLPAFAAAQDKAHGHGDAHAGDTHAPGDAHAAAGDAHGQTNPHSTAEHTVPAVAASAVIPYPGNEPVGKYKNLWDPQNPDAKYHAKVAGVWEGGIHWTDIPAFAGIGGLWIAAFAWRLKQRPLVPPNDPRLPGVLHGGHH